MWKRTIAGAFAVLVAGGVTAEACMPPGPYTSNDEYLACLINDHADMLNRQADIINDHASRIDRLTRDNAALFEELIRQSEGATEYARIVVGLESRVDQQEKTIRELETQLRQRGIAVEEEKFFWRRDP